MQYKVVAVFWQDHMHVSRQQIPLDIEEVVMEPTLTVGLLVKKTKNTIVIVSDIERYKDRDEASYMVIFRPSIIAIKEYGDIEIQNLRFAP